MTIEFGTPSARNHYLNIRELAEFVTESGDWRPAFVQALAICAEEGIPGIYLPADRDPYQVGKGGFGNLSSIRITGFDVFHIVGDGHGSVIQVMGGDDHEGQQHQLIDIYGSTGVILKDFKIDGNKANLLNPKVGQTHGIRIGNDTSGGGVNTVWIDGLLVENVYADGLAIVPIKGGYDDAGTVEGLRITNSKFKGCGRSGSSHQRNMSSVLYDNVEFEDTTNSAIDMEPTGRKTEGVQPQRRFILNNIRIKHAGSNAAAISLSGLASVSEEEEGGPLDPLPSLDITLSNVKIWDGYIGGLHMRHVTLDNVYIEHGSGTDPTIHFRGMIEHVSFRNVTIIRSAASPAQTTVQIQGSNGYYPTNISFDGLKVFQLCEPGSDDTVIYLQNVDVISARGVEVYNGWDDVIDSAIKVVATPLNGVSDVSFDDTKVFGGFEHLVDDELVVGDKFTRALNFSAADGNIDGLSVDGVQGRNFDYGVRFDKSGSGTFPQHPYMNNIAGATIAPFEDLTDATPIIVSGSHGSVAHYVGSGAPGFAAGRGSTYSDIADGKQHKNTTGSTTWVEY